MKQSTNETKLQKPKQQPSIYFLLARVLRLIALVYLSILVYMMYSETSLLFPGADLSKGNWAPDYIDFEEITIDSADDTPVSAFFFPHEQAHIAILFCHGNAENIAMIADEMNWLRSRYQANVLAFDYRGYGKTPGKPFERGINEDAEAALVWLAEQTATPVDEIVVIGRSLGGGVAVHLASKFNPGLLILDRTFSSAVDVAADLYWWLPVRFVMRNQFLSVAKIKGYRGPLLQLHGTSDEVIPFWSAKRLFEASPSTEKEFHVPESFGHFDSWPPQVTQKLDEYLLPNDPSEPDWIEPSIEDLPIMETPLLNELPASSSSAL